MNLKRKRKNSRIPIIKSCPSEAIRGKNDLTGNDFARELLENELHRLHPRVVRYDESGEEIARGKKNRK